MMDDFDMGVSAGFFVSGVVGTLLGLIDYPLIYFSTILLGLSLYYLMMQKAKQ